MWHSPSPPQLPAQLGPGQQSAGGRAGLISRLAVGLAHEEGGAGHHWELMFTTPPTPNGLEYKIQRLET